MGLVDAGVDDAERGAGSDCGLEGNVARRVGRDAEAQAVLPSAARCHGREPSDLPQRAQVEQRQRERAEGGGLEGFATGENAGRGHG